MAEKRRSPLDGPDEDPEALAARIKLPSRPWSPVRNIVVRLFIAVGALVLAAVIVYLEGDCYADRGGRHTSCLVPGQRGIGHATSVPLPGR